MLICEGVTQNIEKRVELLFSGLWCNNDRFLFPEIVEVLECFKNNWLNQQKTVQKGKQHENYCK